MNLWKRWMGWCATTEAGTTLATVRMAMGLLIFIDMVTLISSGVGLPLFSPLKDGGLGTNSPLNSIIKFLGGPSLSLTTYLLWGGLFTSVALIVGLGGRVTSFVMLQILVFFQALSPDICAGYDRLFSNALWLLVLGNGTATLSLDARIRTGSWVSDRQVFAWPRYVLAHQLIVMYVATGIGKTSSLWDAPYHALYYALHRIPYIRIEAPWLSDILPLLQIGTVTTYWWEASFFLVGIWFAAFNGWLGARMLMLSQKYDLRWPYLGTGFVMHMLVWITLDVGPFTWITFTYYLSLFSPDELSSLWRRMVLDHSRWSPSGRKARE